MKVICFGARENEQAFFNTLNKYGYELKLVPELLTEENVDLIQGYETVLLRGNCDAQKNNLNKMKQMGVKYLLTRSVGIDHIDVQEAHLLGFKMARVPSYSPNAIGELAVTLALMLLRNTAEMVFSTSRGDFRIHPSYFSREIRNMNVGIVGVGKIGLITARLFKGLGANIFGYTPNISFEAKQFIHFLPSVKELAQQSNILSLHLPYIREKNYHLINQDIIDAMPSGSIVINVARGEVLDLQAVLNGIQSGKLSGFGTDVLENETVLFNRNFMGKVIDNQIFKELVSLYPKVLITPHMGSNTDEACRNMIEQSFENLNEWLTTQNCQNSI